MIAASNNSTEHHIQVLQKSFRKINKYLVKNIHHEKEKHQKLDILINP